MCVVSSGRAHADVPEDKEIAATIARGVAFLKEAQSPQGHWDENAQNEHRLGMTALAGLALMENGVARDAPEISRAREIVSEMATTSDQTYDIALAILFLARCQQGRRGEADALIRTLGQRLAGGDREGIWDYQVPHSEQEPVPAKTRSRGAAGKRGRAGLSFSRVKGTIPIRSSLFWVCGRQAGTDTIRIKRSRRLITTFGRHSSGTAAGVIGLA